jgi:hypothetical protein
MTDSAGRHDRVPRRSVVMSDRLWSRVTEAAEEIGVTRSAYVRIAVLEKLKGEAARAAPTPPAPKKEEEVSNE